LCPFDEQKVPETKKHAKTRKFALKCLNRMKGDCLENPRNQWQTSPDPYKTIK
jgi:hypothetical protein